MNEKKDPDLFGLIFLSAFCVAAICGICLIFVLILYSIFIDNDIEEIPVTISFTIEEVSFLLILVYMVLLIILFYQSRFLRLYSKDKRKNNYVEEEVVLISSRSFSKGTRFAFLPNLICFFYWKQRANYHKLTFKSLDSGEVDQISYVLTKEKSKICDFLYDTKYLYWDLNIWVRAIEFGGELPLVIVYGRDSRYLKEIRLVDGYNYSDEQVKMVESWTSLCL